MMQRRNRRAGVEDRWRKADGSPSKADGQGKRWRARYVDDSAREHARSFTRKVDAQRWLDQITTAVGTGTYTDPRDAATPFSAIAEAWIATKATKAPKTVAGYRSILDTLVLPRWGETGIGEIRHEELQQWISSLSVEGASKRTGRQLSASRIRQTHQQMNAIYKYAIRVGRVAVNPTIGIELPDLVSTDKVYLDHAELHALAHAAGRHRLMVLTLGYCGLRFGEAVALKAGSVSASRITVRESVTEVSGKGQVLGRPKNREIREVPIPEFLATELTIAKPSDPDALMFPSIGGGWLWSSGEFRGAFHEAREVIGKPDLRTHDLRHTAASLAISAGANVKVVQRMLGHKSATMTLDLYGHLLDDDLDLVAQALSKAAADALRTEGKKKGKPGTVKVS